MTAQVHPDPTGREQACDPVLFHQEQDPLVLGPAAVGPLHGPECGAATEAELDACASLSHLLVCVNGAVGSLQASPAGASSSSRVVGYLGAALGTRVRLGRAAIWLLAGIEIPVVRTTIYVDDRQVWAAPAAAGFFALEASFEIRMTDPVTSSHDSAEPRRNARDDATD